MGVNSIAELRAAYKAAEAGAFRAGGPVARSGSELRHEWSPGENVIVVVGAHGGAGATSVALALASAAAPLSARLIECARPEVSGLAAAAQAELGNNSAGWTEGSRGSVLIQRRASGAGVPKPSGVAAGTGISIVDIGTEVGVALTDAGWIGDLVRRAHVVVVVARGTVPGLRRLEAVAALLGRERVHAVLVSEGKHLPKSVGQSAREILRQLGDRVTLVPTDRSLALAGITPEPLPTAVVAACSELVNSLKGSSLQ